MSTLALSFDRPGRQSRRTLRPLLGITINLFGAVLVGSQAVQALLAIIRG